MLGSFSSPWTIDSYVRSALIRLGCEVVAQQEGPAGYSRAVDAAGVVEAARRWRPDLFLWMRTWDAAGDPAAMVAALRDLGCPTASLTMDLFAPLARGEEVGRHPFWTTDVVLTPDGGSDEFWRERGVRHRWCPPGVAAEECLLAAPDPALAVDVAFVGGVDCYHPEWPWRRELVDFLRRTYGDRFRLHPGTGSPVRGLALNRLYASAGVVVGDTLSPGFAHRDYWSDRVPETLGRGGLLVMPELPGLAERFTGGEHLVYHRPGDLDDLRRVIDLYLRPEMSGERERIRRAGHEHVKALWTYDRVARQVLDDCLGAAA